MKQQVHGNVTGVRDTLIEALGQLYDYEVDEDTFLPRELMQVLARFTGVLNREIAVYITRDGEVVDVSIGTDRDVELRDYRLRRNTQRLSCVRCIHTHPNGDGRLSDVDLSALRSFRYDAMVAIGCLKGEPTFVQSAFLVEKQNLLMDEPVRWYKTPDGDWMRQITESDRIVGWEADEKGTHVKERAVLMAIESMESLDELARLADTAGAEVVGQFLQKKDKPDTALFIGRGRADELCRQCQALEADLCIFDEELTGIQARNLEEILRVKVVDRTTLILDIFAQRASSAEGKLQVELAQLQYQSSRLIGQGLVLSRLAGGIGTRGPGESKLEMNRRHIRERMTELRRRLDAVEKQRELRRKSREKNEIPVVALVGYTNAGKSSLLSLVSGSEVMARDMLFATLDTTTRKIELPNGQPLLLTDTVGFIRNLPHRLVEAFKSTLEEAVLADFLVQVVDASDPEAVRHYETTLEVLAELGAGDKPMIVVLNKLDLVPEEERAALTERLAPHFNGSLVCMSVREEKGTEDLLRACVEMLESRVRRARFLIPYTRSDLAAAMHSEGMVISTEYVEEGALVEAVLPVAFYNKVSQFLAEPSCEE